MKSHKARLVGAIRRPQTMPSPSFYSAIARSILAGQAVEEPIAARIAKSLGRNWRWVRPLARRYLRAFEPDARPRRKAVIAFLQADSGLKSACQRYGNQVRVVEWLNEPAPMQPVSGAQNWVIPTIESAGKLAQWLGISCSELDWFADLSRLTAKGPASWSSSLNHYHYRILAKESGNFRLIEAPKARLKEIQRKILDEILNHIPVHEAAHGFRKAHSIKTFAARHVGQRVVVRMDLKDFFPSISGGRVQALFRAAGYPESVADLLGGICTDAVPRSLWTQAGKGLDPLKMSEARSIYARPHLPQGAPTSPALANICAYRTDCRLAGLAGSVGAVYTRYADDLAFSGGESFKRSAERFSIHVAAILMEEGFAVHHRKTRIMRSSVRQYLAGLVINERLNVPRPDYDRLKATLTNCLRHGPGSQNRLQLPDYRRHLEGCVGFVESVNPVKGTRLRRILEQIEW